MKMTRVLRKLLLGFALCMAFNIFAQETGARIYHLEGSNFALTINGERSVFSDQDLKNSRIPLERSGIVHTGAGTFLEIQILPSGAVIKMSDNTSLVYNGIDSSGGFIDLGLLYGRVRVITGEGRGAAPVVVRSGGISSRIERGDFGADYYLEPSDKNAIPRPVFRVHSFRGNVEVFPYGKGASPSYFGSAQTLSVAEGESFSLDISSAFTFAEKRSLGIETVNYWTANNFKGQSPVSMPPTVIKFEPGSMAQAPVSAESSPIYISDPFGQQKQAVTANRAKTVGLAIGIALTLAAAATQGITYYRYDIHSSRTANTVFNAAYVPLGVGIFTSIGALLYNPSPSKR